MTVQDYLKKKGIKQIEIASTIGAPISSINLFCRGWKPLPEKHVVSFAEFVGLSVEEIKTGKVKVK